MKSIPAAMIFSSGEYTGADSYTDLIHKPRINDVELSGIKSSADLGLADADDVYTKSEIDTLLDDKADSSDVYTKTETDGLLDDKADSADVYTKTEVDSLLDDKADKSTTYTKTEVDGLLDELKVKIPDAPDTDGTYTLKVTVTDGVSSYNWVSD